MSMRELTKEQRELLEYINTPEYLARKAKEYAEDQAAMARARAIAEARYAEERARYEKEQSERDEKIRPLKEALRAAGIKLDVTSYEGVWGSYQIGSGPVVDFDDDSLDTFAED